MKVAAAIQNAKAFLAVQEEFGSFDVYIWQFVGGKPKVNAFKTTRSAVRSLSYLWLIVASLQWNGWKTRIFRMAWKPLRPPRAIRG